ncbi:unnamed protein product [Mytilus coruscus]|uniref:Uncharacterized protein n=1 Tax=Mytilus coruscus TaxID=42192 RepID=A0A6J8BS00_MYTCO|nr:unnamed protein product [Mytilus coruscus]
MQEADESVDSRERKTTEKGLLYNLELKQKERTKLLKSLNGVYDELEQLTSETKDTDTVKQVYTTWVSLYEQLLVSHEQFQNLLKVEHDRELDEAWFQERNKNFITLNDNVEQWFISNQVPKIVVTSAQEDSMSRISRGSRPQEPAVEEQRKAELLARANSLADKKKELEEAKLQLRMREEELEIKTEMQVSEAKVKVIEKKKQDTTVKQKVLFGTDINNNIETSKIHDHSFKQKGDVNQLNTIHSILIARELNKPKADITKFDGSPMEYKSFLRQFDARVVANTDSFDEKLNFLLQFTIGEPHRIVSGFSHLDAKKGYEAALEEFNDRYGDPDVIAHAYVKRALDWTKKVVDSSVISGLEVCDINGNNAISLPPIFTRPNLPVSRKDIVSSNDLREWPHLRDVPLNRVDCDVGLLIGINVPRAMEPWDVIASVDNSPFAMKTLLGWVINGPLDVVSTDQVVGMFVSSNQIVANQIFPSLEDHLRNHFNYEFSERTIDDEDKKKINSF